MKEIIIQEGKLNMLLYQAVTILVKGSICHFRITNLILKSQWWWYLSLSLKFLLFDKFASTIIAQCLEKYNTYIYIFFWEKINRSKIYFCFSVAIDLQAEEAFCFCFIRQSSKQKQSPGVLSNCAVIFLICPGYISQRGRLEWPQSITILSLAHTLKFQGGIRP